MKKANNFLDYVFEKEPAILWEADEDGKITLFVEHKGLSAFLAQKAFHRPKTTQVHLEAIGSFLWERIDGQRSVYDLGQLLEQCAEDVQPLYERLSVYMKQMERGGLIRRRRKRRRKWNDRG